MNPRLFRRTGALILVTVAAAALTGCGGGIGAKLTFADVEKVKVDRIVLDGDSGDIQVSTAAITETRITRIVHSGSDPGPSYLLTGSELRLDGSCGPDCRVSYQVEAPAGVTVTGTLGSGTVALDGVAGADVQVRSGDIAIRNATGPVRARSTSGDVTVADTKGPATIESTSGDVRALQMAGAVTVRSVSGDVTVKLAAPASVDADASSGDIQVLVPAGDYAVRAHAGSGDTRVAGITNDATSKNVLDVRAASGDVSVVAAPAA